MHAVVIDRGELPNCTLSPSSEWLAGKQWSFRLADRLASELSTRRLQDEMIDSPRNSYLKYMVEHRRGSYDTDALGYAVFS
eukprot:scaffold142_cov155-Amphora_coffeaeformis.AAC.7